jgi:hypothetical protein
MFFIISWRWVVKVVADMSTMSTIVTILTVMSVDPMKREESWARSSVDCSAWAASDLLSGPIGG